MNLLGKILIGVFAALGVTLSAFFIALAAAWFEEMDRW